MYTQVYVCIPCPYTPVQARGGIWSLELELQVVISQQVGAGNWTEDLHKNTSALSQAPPLQLKIYFHFTHTVGNSTQVSRNK